MSVRPRPDRRFWPRLSGVPLVAGPRGLRGGLLRSWPSCAARPGATAERRRIDGADAPGQTRQDVREVLARIETRETARAEDRVGDRMRSDELRLARSTSCGPPGSRWVQEPGRAVPGRDAC